MNASSKEYKTATLKKSHEKETCLLLLVVVPTIFKPPTGSYVWGRKNVILYHNSKTPGTRHIVCLSLQSCWVEREMNRDRNHTAKFYFGVWFAGEKWKKTPCNVCDNTEPITNINHDSNKVKISCHGLNGHFSPFWSLKHCLASK